MQRKLFLIVGVLLLAFYAACGGEEEQVTMDNLSGVTATVEKKTQIVPPKSTKEMEDKKDKPIVALESTLISHGLPYPENIKVAKLSIEAVRRNGSIPATIAIIDGKIKVGLDDKEINILGKNNNINKVSRHNLSIAISNKHYGATTVAACIYIASQLGI